MNGTLTPLNQLLRRDWLFEIPLYQRGYAWEEENLRDLWDDLYYLGEKQHYFGTILLKDLDKKTKAGWRAFDHYEVIDGQQRLTTTLILLRELISQIKEFGEEEGAGHVSRLEEDYIGTPHHYKLTIGGDDRFFFHDSILAGTSADPQTRAQKRLKSAQDFFRTQFDHRREQLGDQYLDFLSEFKDGIDRLEVMLYIVPSNAEAVRMFETVNDRGRPLTNLEKTKSILMYASYLVVHDRTTLDKLLDDLNGHFTAIYRSFQEIEEGLGLRDAGDIQRYHHIFFFSASGDAHMRKLKDRLMGKSREDPEECERFIRDYASSLRQAFATMQDIARRRHDDSVLGRAINRLFLVGPVGNLYPLLIAAWRKFGEASQREDIIRLFEAFVFRGYRVVRLRSHTGRVWIYPMAREVHRDGFTFERLQRKLMEMHRHYANDDAFRQALSGTHCYLNLGTRTIRYLLAQYEERLRRDAGERMTLPFAEILSSEYETEHILPQHPAGDLGEEEIAAHQDIVHRLGNLTIASKQCNQIIGNRPFEEKRDGRGEPGYEKCCYRNSILHVQKNLARYDQWNESSIQERGDAIIAFALERWRIDPMTGPRAKAAQASY